MNNSSNDSLPHHPLHHHNPWGHAAAPDPDEPDIEHVEWNPAPGVHFARTSYRSSNSNMNSRGSAQNDPFGPFFQTFSTMLEDVGIAQRRSPGQAQARNVQRMNGPHHIHRPEFAAQNPFPDHHHHHIHQHHHNGPWNPGPPGGRNVFTATGRWPPAGPNPFPNPQPGNPAHKYVKHPHQSQVWTANALRSVLATLLQTMQANIAQQNPNNPGMGAMPGFLSQILGAGAHGDAVYTDEALDRVITQMMDQTNSNSAPGPASAEAIARLPQKTVDKAMLGQDGKAECSVCMDTVEIGDQVTELPCKHWFHGDCVGAWLKEHDTCPHCRQGIMPKDGPEEAHTPRSPYEAPRHSQNSFLNSNRANFSQHPPPAPSQLPSSPSTMPGHAPPGGTQTPLNGPVSQPGMQQPYMPGGFPNYPEPRSFVVPTGQNPTHPSSQVPPAQRRPQEGHRRRSSARISRTRGNSNNNGGEGSNNSGNGVTGWFRNLRGGSNNANR